MPRYGGRLALPIAAVQGVRMMVRRLRRGPAGTFVAVWRLGPESAEPDLVFRTDAEEVPSMSGSADGTVLGEYAPNGALLVDVGGRRIRPTYNPQRPYGDLTRGLGSTMRTVGPH
jgi:hypothetical protein